jgi:hypothetical protein
MAAHNSSLPDLIRQSMLQLQTFGDPAWTTGIGERSDAVLRTAIPGGDEQKTP